MTTTTDHPTKHHLLNLLLSMAFGAALFIGVPIAMNCGVESYKTIANWTLVLRSGSPFHPTAHYYHPGDKMDVFARRYSNFEAEVDSTRLLRLIHPGTDVEDAVDRQPAHMLPLEKGDHTVIFHPVLPDPLPPGKYHYVFTGHYVMYDRMNSFVWRTENFEVVSKETPLKEDMGPGSRATGR